MKTLTTYVDAYKARAVLYRQMKKDNLAAADDRKAAEIVSVPKGGTLSNLKDYSAPDKTFSGLRVSNPPTTRG